MTAERYDLLVRGGTAVLPDVGPVRADVAARDGVIVAIGDLDGAHADTVIEARGKLVLPGAVDSHFHLGIYRPHAEDTRSETASALVGGVTSVLSYFRTGSHYLNKTGPYATIFPEVLRLSEGNAHTDYGYHLAIMTADQLAEVPALVRDHGVGSFKFYMFYIGLNLAADSTAASAYTMAESYDLGHLYRLMERVATAAREHAARGRISLSIHCETADIIRTCVAEQRAAGANDLAAWSRARPPFSEAMAITQATLLAARVGCPLNVLHISSAEALDAARMAHGRYPGLDLRLETTLHHLALTTDTAGDTHGKVNPPIRGSADVDAMWAAVADGRVGTVASDHAACPDEMKTDDLWSSQPGFGGTALLYPVLLSEGFHKRHLPLARLVDLAAGEPARRFGLETRKGSIAPGLDADLAIVDPEREITVAPELLLSAQPYTPFSGLRLRGWVTHTVLRGKVAYAEGKVAGTPGGAYLRRPLA